MTVKGALKAKEAVKASAIVVSNHGGRVLDQRPRDSGSTGRRSCRQLEKI